MGATAGLSAESLLRRLEWRVVRRLDGRLQGDYRTFFRGSGIDFTDLREYVPGDDLRHIEWNVTARLDEPYVREFVEDRELTAWLLLDHSASMGFGPVDRQKDLVLAEVATTLAHVLTRGGSRVGAIVLDTGVDTVIAPGSGRNQVLRIAHDLLARRTSRAGDRAPSGSVTDLGTMLAAAYGIAKRRSLVLVVSDFITADGWEAPLGRLARRHEVVAIQVTDPRESELPDAGGVYVEDVETGEQIFVDTSDVAFRARLAAAAQARQADLEARARRAGVDLYAVRTDDDLVRSLMRISELRRRRRR
ncbi:DUF58 domain-containing protein [Humibacillus xanthopallidus]|uniref:Uncharacterized protein DUF58 n=1 Tax=Humibacillus xanthopallidus TaxID=412689 RepID=A0A543H885_9MICO|nr:DUF58 domain-containing protein [Humibacillus xanthopallidus]TQM54557.1 uncharacterized protein DUF58 [Humibacillus xanthopallidus]